MAKPYVFRRPPGQYLTRKLVRGRYPWTDDGLVGQALDEPQDPESDGENIVEALAVDGFSLTDDATATGWAIDEGQADVDDVDGSIEYPPDQDAVLALALDEPGADFDDPYPELEPLLPDAPIVDDGSEVQALDEGGPDLEDNIEDASEPIAIDSLFVAPPTDDGTTIVQALDFPQEDDEQILEIIGIDVPAVALLAAIPILRRKYDYLRRSWNPPKPVEQVGPEAAHTEILTEHYSLNRPDQRFMVLKIKREVAIVETRPKPAPATYTVRAKPRVRPPTLEEDEEAVAALLLGH